MTEGAIASPQGVQTEGPRVWIEGVDHEAFDIHWDMHVRAARTLLRARGVELTLPQVMALSGDAFNLCHATHFQGTAYLGAPHDPMQSLADALGFEYQALTDGYTGWVTRRRTMDERRALTDAALARIAEQIRAGHPVMVGGAEEHCGTWTLAVGIDMENQQFCHVGTGVDIDAQAYRWVPIRGVAADAVQPDFGVMDGRVRGALRPGLACAWHANAAYLFKDRRPTQPSPTDRAIETLALAVRLFHAESHHRPNWGQVRYDFGRAAYRQWARDLEHLVNDRKATQPDDAYDWFEMGNMDMQVDQIVTGRTAAAAFCDEAAELLPDAAGLLKEAAEHYRQEVELARQAFAAFIPRFNGDDKPRIAYLSDPQKCKAGAAVIRQMLEAESAAVHCLQRVLSDERVLARRTPPELSQIELRGNDHVDDSLSMALRASARVLRPERPIDYETVYGLSTNAFAPMVNKAEDCTSHWHCEAAMADRAIEHAAASMGLRAVRLDLPELNREWDGDRQRDARKLIAQQLQTAMDQGAIVLTTGGWDLGLRKVDEEWKVTGPHGFVFWGAAGLVTDVDAETGTILGAHPNGHRDNPVIYPATMWALTPATQMVERTPSMIDRRTLNLAADRIRARGRFVQTGNSRYGADAMRAWIDHMAGVEGFCAPCWDGGKGKSWTDAMDNGKRLHRAATLAATYLETMHQRSPKPARQSLESAADHYRNISKWLEPFVTKGSDDHYKKWIGDMGKQHEHAKLLQRVDAELLAAADDMQRAARAMVLRRSARSAWLDGAADVFYEHFCDSLAHQTTPWAQRSDSYMCLTQMKLAGLDADYATLNTVAGHGPSFAYAPRPSDKWGRHYFPPAGRDERMGHATGYRVTWRRYENPEDYWQALKHAIDAGYAVHGPNEEDVLFIGYTDADKPEDRKVMPLAVVFVGDNEWTWDQFVQWHSRRMVGGWFGRMEAPEEPWPVRQSAIEVMKMMVRVGRGDDPRRREGDGVVWGVDGIEAYARDLADMSKSGAPEGEGGFFQGGWRGCHNVYPQASGRPAAAKYLRRIAPHFAEEPRAHIESAAAAYERATEAWAAYFAELGRPEDRPVPVDHAMCWTTERYRKAGAAAMRDAAACEREALAELEQALDAMETDRP